MSGSGSVTELTRTTPERPQYFGDGEECAPEAGELHILRPFFPTVGEANVGELHALGCENEAFVRRPDRSGLAGI